MSNASRRAALAGASPLRRVKGIGPARERELAENGFQTVIQLLMHIPRRYEDRRVISKLAQVVAGSSYTLIGRLEKLETVRLYRRRMTMVRAKLRAGSAELAVTWFNRPYLAKQVRADEDYLLHGPVRSRGEALELVNPSLERVETARLAARVVPVYSPIGALGPAAVRRFVDAALAELGSEALPEALPLELLDRHRLPGLADALLTLHRPGEGCDVEELNRFDSPAHHRLVYGELLALQGELALARSRARALRKGHRYRQVRQVHRRLSASLPFALTGSQARVLDQIADDLEDRSPMTRLLQGDVGSGKTVVAAIALASAVESGLQGALMAPTELLAEQHFHSLGRLLGSRYRLELVTSVSAKAGVLEALGDGTVDIAVGTHALFQRAVDFGRLGLAVVDEQHRFGVGQRRRLLSKGDCPDLLVMTATPIPRSLALTIYGDLAVSVIDELPPGRRPVETRLSSEAERGQVYDWLEGELEAGHKAFVVLPLIEDSDRVAAGAIEGLGRELADRLRRYGAVILHGRVDAEERNRTMAEFAVGSSSVLIATSLVEVGVDVPEATAMVIESAERFGLAQLHQLRGRVGRGLHASTCVAVHGDLNETSRRRLEMFSATTDGFALAEADLEIRGPGDLLGTRQAGMPNLRLSDLVRHREWIEKARADARRLVERAPESGAAFLLELRGKPGPEAPLAGA